MVREAEATANRLRMPRLSIIAVRRTWGVDQGPSEARREARP